MSLFIALSGLLVLAAVLFVAGPLFTRRGGTVDRDDVEAIARTRQAQLADLERELEDGEIDNRTYELLRRDIERDASDRQASAESGAANRTGRPVTAIVMTVLLPVAAIGLYLVIGTPSAIDRPSADMSEMDLDEAVAALESRLDESPDNLQGWTMLGRTRFAMGEYGKAEEAYRRALELTDDDDTRLLANYAEAMALNQPQEMVSRAGPLFQRVLAADPDHPKGLWYSGLIAFEQGNFETAVGHWQVLMAQDPPEAFRTVLRDRIEAAREAGGLPAPAQGIDADDTSGEGVQARVSLADSLADRVSPNDTVFLIARAAEGGGPPLAGLRLTVASLPGTFRLSDENAMIEGRSISGHERIEIVARVSLSGEAIPQAGDLEGSQVIRVEEHREEPVTITIDRVIEENTAE